MVKMMIFVAHLLTADGATYATIKTQPVPAADCLRALSVAVDAAEDAKNTRVRYACVVAEARQ